jgi:hypothetical protein
MEVIINPIIIEDNEVCLYGIYRGIENPLRIIVLIPALTGTRIGPQRMFVEICNYLKQKNGTVCFDFPYAGDSIDKRNLKLQNLRKDYNYYLSKIYSFLQQKYPKSEIIFMSISVGCMPILEFSENMRLDKVILLSPNHLSNTTHIVNNRNIYAYFIRLFQFKTWQKVLFLKLNFHNIYKNIFNVNKKRISQVDMGNPILPRGKVNLLCVFGENDPNLRENQRFWVLNKTQSRFISYKESIVSNSDHSFMGWNSKKELLVQISNWLN